MNFVIILTMVVWLNNGRVFVDSNEVPQGVSCNSIKEALEAKAKADPNVNTAVFKCEKVVKPTDA